ncbi:MAG: PLP-dependent aminotransferase family protein [Parvibaculaceae bacterium]
MSVTLTYQVHWTKGHIVKPDRRNPVFARRAGGLRASEIRELLKLLDRPGMLSFAGGIPDPSLFPLDAFRHAFAQALAENGGALQYSTSEGHPPLRDWIARRMSTLGIGCSEDNILITHGSQQALDLIGKLFVDPASPLVTEAPTYLGALQSFSAFEPDFATVRFRDGRAETNASAARLIYLIPDFANPTGATLPLGARKSALDLARRTGAVVVEDAAYSDLRYDGDGLPAIAALDIAQSGSLDAARTLYCGTFSKTLSPGLRVGWICGPARLVRRLTLVKQAADLHTATVNQEAVHRVAADHFDRAVRQARAVYAGRRDAMIAALERHAPQGVGWTTPAGGLFVWLTLPPPLDSGALLDKAIARNIAFVPGSAFFADGGGAGHLRLSFSLLGEEAIARGVEALCRLIADELRQGGEPKAAHRA